MKYKKCAACEIKKPLSGFSTRKRKHKIYVYSKCKSCIKDYKIEYKEKNKEKVKAKQHEIYLRKASETIVKSALWKKENKESVKKSERKYYIKNKKIISEKSKIYRVKNKDKISQGIKIYKIINREKILEKQRAYNKTFAGRMSIRNYNHKRRTSLRGGNIKTKYLMSLKAVACGFGTCPVCGKKDISKWWCEHDIPLSKGGKHDVNNVFYDCEKCNRSKGAKTLKEFIGFSLSDLIRKWNSKI